MPLVLLMFLFTSHLQSNSASRDVLRESWNWESVVSLRWVAKGKEGTVEKSERCRFWFAMPHSLTAAFRRKVHGAAIETAKREYVGRRSGMRFEVAKLIFQN